MGAVGQQLLCYGDGLPGLVVVGAPLEPAVFADASDTLITLDAEDSYAANMVGRGQTVLVAAGHPRVVDALSHHGIQARVVPTTETRKADGSLTCSALLLPPGSSG